MSKLKQIRTALEFIDRAPKSGPRVLVADIETFPIIAYVWGCFKQNVGVEQIKDDFKLMSFAGKWLNDNAYFYIDNRYSADPRDDTNTASSAWLVLNHTDIVVAHNGKSFDMRKLRARFAARKLAPLPVIPVIDTLLENRKAFAFDSQRLAYVSKKFGNVAKYDHKNFPGFELWRECMEGNIKAWKENQAYNVTDITSLESMYLELRGWYQGAANLGNYTDEDDDGQHRCPNCGGTHTVQRGYRRTQVGVYPRFRCNDCGGWSRGRYQTVSAHKRKHVLTN